MSIQLKAAPPPDSDSGESEDVEQDESVQKRLKLMKEIADERKSSKSELIGGIVVTSEHQSETPSSSASLSAAEKKGLKEVEELERELDLKNTFSRETNRRDEDAEMNRYIDEQLRQRRLEAERERREQQNLGPEQMRQEQSADLSDLFTLPTGAVDPANAKVDDILLHQLVKNYSTKTNEKSEAMLSSQMLNGIPEVDLGLSERIRTIEATEEAKIRLASGSNQRSKPTRSTVPINYSTNFQQHRYRDRNEGDLRSNQNRDVNNTNAKTICEPVVIVGEEPREIELRVPSTGNDQIRPPSKGRASDDYHLQKFKKNSRR